MRTLSVLVFACLILALSVPFGTTYYPEASQALWTDVNSFLVEQGAVEAPISLRTVIAVCYGIVNGAAVLLLMLAWTLTRTNRRLTEEVREAHHVQAYRSDEVTNLKEKIEELEEQLETLAEPQVLKAKLEASEKDVERLTKERDDLDSVSDDLQEENNQLTEKLHAADLAKTKLEAEGQEQRDLEEELAALKKEAEQLREEKIKLLKDYHELKGRHEGMQLGIQQGTLDTRKKEIDTRDQQLATKQKELDNLKAENELKKKELDQRDKGLQEDAKRLVQNETRVQKLIEEMNPLRQRIEEHEKTMRQALAESNGRLSSGTLEKSASRT